MVEERIPLAHRFLLWCVLTAIRMMEAMKELDEKESEPDVWSLVIAIPVAVVGYSLAAFLVYLVAS